MAFTKKRSRYVAGRAFGRPPKEKRIFRRRRRRGLFASLALTLLLLAGLGAAAVSSLPPSGANDGPVQRVDAPAVAGAPEPVVDIEAREAAERARAQKAAKERAAKEKEAAEKEAAEEKAAEEQAAKEKEAAAPPAPEDPTMYLTVPRLGVYGHTVRNDDSQWALDLGAIKVPETGFPWQEPATNTYIAGHRVGWPGTESHYQFYNLPAMQKGDEVVLEDTNGAVYTYRVTEIFAVHPWETRVTRPIPGRNVVSLQTCTESVDDWWTLGPDLYSGGPQSGRLVVRADRVD